MAKKKKGVSKSYKDVFGDEGLLEEKLIREKFKLASIEDLTYGMIMGYHKDDFIVNDRDINALILAPPGVGKTKTHAITNSIFNACKNISQIIMDSKDEIRRTTQAMFESMGLKTYVLDLRHPQKSLHWNMMDLVNKYIDLYKLFEKDKYKAVKYYAKAEEYALRISTAIINQEDAHSNNHGDNAFFRDTAKGLLTSMILLVSENCKNNERHIKSVYKTIQQFSGMESETDNELMSLFKTINAKRTNSISKISDFGYASAIADVRTFKNIISSTLTQVQDFLQSDLEQILCHNSEININDFIKEKSVIYVIVPDEKKTRHFLGSLFVQNFVNELITYAESEPGGRLARKVLCYWDEFGNMPRIPDFITLITAARSRNINITNVLQSLIQLKQTYGDKVYEVLKECYQVIFVGCLSPLANETAELLSKATGEYTLAYNTRSRSTNAFSFIHSSTNNSEQLVKRAVMKPEDFKKLKVGEWVVFSIGNSVYKHNFEQYFDVFDYDFKETTLPDREYKEVEIATREKILANILYEYDVAKNKINIPKPYDISLDSDLEKYYA